jgi:methylenetetrahydrofolate--tRNA-(uracil-5-)-methyltransferase
MLGGLYRYLREADPRHFQPMNANFGLLDPLEAAKAGRGGKEARKQALVERARRDFQTWLSEL